MSDSYYILTFVAGSFDSVVFEIFFSSLKHLDFVYLLLTADNIL